MARPLRVGVQLPEVERQVPWAEYAAMARAAEEVGFDSLWVGDHLLYRESEDRPERGPWHAWSLLAGLAAVTERVRLGPLVACTAFHLPGVLAKAAATVDEISGGRLTLGLGAGWNEEEFRAFGIPFEHRATRFIEAFEIIRLLLDGERVTLHGRFHDADDLVLLPAPERRPSLLIGSNGDRLLTATLPYVDAWNTWYARYGNTPDGFAEHSAIVDRAAERVGRDPAEIERTASVFVVTDRSSPERTITDEAPPIEGDASRVAERLHGFAEAGVTEAILVLSPITEASIRTMGETLAALDA
jgi:probable F420-dependent oxidoreductase